MAQAVAPVGNAAPAAGDQGGGQKSLMEILHWLAIFFVMQNMMGLFATKFAAKFRPPPPPPPRPIFEDSAESSPVIDQFMFPDAIAAAKGRPLGVIPSDVGVGVGEDEGSQAGVSLATGHGHGPDVLITDSPNAPSSWRPSSLATTAAAPGDVSLGSSPGRDERGTGDDDNDIAGGSVLAEWHERDLIFGGVAVDDGLSSDSGGERSPSLLSSLFGPSNANQAMNRRNATLVVPIAESVHNNETGVYAHVRLRRRRSSGANSPTDALVKTMALTRHRKRKRNRDVKSLLDSESDSNESIDRTTNDDSSVLTLASLNRTHDQVLLYMKPSLTLQIIDIGTIDFPTRASIPRQFSDHMDWYEDDPARDWYYPILYRSEFWITSASLREVNGTLKESRLDVNFEPVAMWKWQLQSQTEENWRKQEDMTGEVDQGNDVLRNMLLETNPYLLAVTAIVSILHTVFDILAFKNDISFFKNKKSMEGISLRSMIVNAGFSLVILLYLADNDTSYMVLMSNGVGLAIETWKISKAVTVSFEGGRIEWVEATSYTTSKTKEYDEIATSHLLFVTMPLVAGYGMYSLFYQKHKGWYSWILNTLVGFIYMFGFVMMTPQLFINYKLQSVAHLNWRTMSYKSINTFIDDLFAFVIKMPIMHRLACLRDDLIFFVYLYQRYCYKVDYTRVNEFGQCAQPGVEMLAEIERKREIAAAAVDEDKTEKSGKRRGAREKWTENCF
ncbi:hypothetical protein ACHAW5_005094 [Stephanodiscus triporus]|uniref:Uncharacterized protein n=1 Tax=Stephanodiscus triporus TaxID=2934178 RepID=A0ABD3PR32_9STRA